MSVNSENEERIWTEWGIKEAAGKLYVMGLDTEKIAQAVGYAVETVKGWLGIES